MVEKYIAALKEIENPQIINNYTLEIWKSKTTNVLERIYGKGSIKEEQIKRIQVITYATRAVNGKKFGGGNNAKDCNQQASEMIKGFISDLTSFGLPKIEDKKVSDGINISLSQHQNQTMNVNIILEAINDELTGKQRKELEDILKQSATAEDKKKSILEKLKSFGGDVATNIVANILTNPAIYGG